MELFKKKLEKDSSLKPQSKQIRLWSLGKPQKTWPKLWPLRLNQIIQQACEEWPLQLPKKAACHCHDSQGRRSREAIMEWAAPPPSQLKLNENPARQVIDSVWTRKSQLVSARRVA